MNYALILQEGPALQALCYNEFNGQIEVQGSLPWSRSNTGWTESDLSNLLLYLDRTYGLDNQQRLSMALSAVLPSMRSYHPLKQYLEGLSWDGRPRADTLLVDYLGAEDSPYVRAVTALTLLGAVARVYEPGCKFDTALVTCGPRASANPHSSAGWAANTFPTA